MSLSAGFARRDITPGPEPSLVGYGQRLDLHGTGNAGVLDALHVRALAVTHGSERLLILSFDLCVLTPPLAQSWREHLAAELAWPVDSILLAATHTHSGPHARLPGIEDSIFQLATGTGEADTRYAAFVLARAIEAARDAIADLHPHTLFWNHAPLGFAYNRRVPTADGIRMCWNPRESPDLTPGPAPDPACVALIFRDQAGGEILLWSAAAHPVVLGKESNVVSADWPGAACAQLEALHPTRRAIFLLGPCGELHPWIATQGDPSGVHTAGAAAAHFVHLLAEGAQTERAPSLRGIAATCNTMPLSAWNIGGLLLLTAPVELFASLSARLRAASGPPLLISTLTNGWHAYFPDRESFAQGAYEIEVALACGRKPGDGEDLLARLEFLARPLLRAN